MRVLITAVRFLSTSTEQIYRKKTCVNCTTKCTMKLHKKISEENWMYPNEVWLSEVACLLIDFLTECIGPPKYVGSIQCSGERFVHIRLRSECFQIQPVTC
jgi:hypothetical protein